MKILQVKTKKPIKAKYILIMDGQQLEYMRPSHNKKLEWATYNGAEKFLEEHSLCLDYQGEFILKRDEIEIVEIGGLTNDKD